MGISDYIGECAAEVLGDVLGETIVHWPRGVEADAEDVDGAIVDRSETMPDGQVIASPAGVKLPYQCRVSVPKSVTVTVNEKPENVSNFIFDGYRWWAKLAVGEDGGDEALRTFVCVRAGLVASRRV